MKTALPLLVAALVLPVIATAQERTAGQAMDAQVNWAALKTSINQVSTQNKAIAASLSSLQGQVATLTTTVNTLNSKVVVLDGKMSALASCGAQKKFWNGSTCAALTVCHETLVKSGSKPGPGINPADYCPSGTRGIVTGTTDSPNGHGGTNISYACYRTDCRALTDGVMLP